MARMTPEMIALCYGSLVAYLADFAFAFCVRTAWSPRRSE
jgi:hypothetical protein